MAKKIQKMRYKFEEEIDEQAVRGVSGAVGATRNREPQKFRGYVDETYTAAADSTSGGNSTYAIMIYDVSINNL